MAASVYTAPLNLYLGRSCAPSELSNIDRLRRVGRLTELAVWAPQWAAWQGMSLRYVRSIAL